MSEQSKVISDMNESQRLHCETEEENIVVRERVGIEKEREMNRSKLCTRKPEKKRSLFEFQSRAVSDCDGKDDYSTSPRHR